MSNVKDNAERYFTHKPPLAQPDTTARGIVAGEKVVTDNKTARLKEARLRHKDS